MLRRLRTIPALSLAVLLFVPPLAARAQAPEPAFDTPAPSSRTEGLRSLRAPALLRKDHNCVIRTITCGQTIASSIDAHDCRLSDGSFYELFEFVGLDGETAVIDMNSNAVDPYLFLLAPNGDTVAEDDNGGPGDDARIVFELDESSNFWTIAPNAFDPGSTGPYTLSLQCVGDDTPAGFFRDATYPDFAFRVRIDTGDTIIDGIREPVCQPDTVCVSGALPGRSELFVRILGPRPNGFLWPTLVRFTPSGVVVDIEQISTGLRRTYTLDPIPPGTEELPGLQDRTGFQP